MEESAPNRLQTRRSNPVPEPPSIDEHGPRAIVDGPVGSVEAHGQEQDNGLGDGRGIAKNGLGSRDDIGDNPATLRSVVGRSRAE